MINSGEADSRKRFWKCETTKSRDTLLVVKMPLPLLDAMHHWLLAKLEEEFSSNKKELAAD